MALPKLFERIFWHNNTTPAINEDNLNAMSKAIDDIDDRVILIGDDVVTVIPQIQAYLEQAQTIVEAVEELSQNPPYIGANGNWYVFDTTLEAYKDSGVDASITVDIADITMIAEGAQPYVTNTGTSTDPIFHLFLPRSPQGATGNGIANIAKTSTQGLVDTYTITMTDGTTYTFTVTNGQGIGDMTKAVYDSTNAVADAGGITDYVEGKVEPILNVLGAKNLLPNTVVSQTLNGVTFTVNADGSISCSGTSTAELWWNLSVQTPLDTTKEYILSGCPSGGDESSTYSLGASDGNTLWRFDEGSGVSFTPTGASNTYITIHIKNGINMTGKVFKPMLRLSSITDSTYEPYALTNQQLTPYALSQSNPNLLDNPWFTINQRGATSVTTTWTYFVDRWRTGNNAYNLVINNDKTITFKAGGITEINQAIEYDRFNLGKVYTLSVMLSDGTIRSVSGVIKQKSQWTRLFAVKLSDTDDIWAAIDAEQSYISASIYVITDLTADLTIKAMKLELGSVSTLAHDTAPNYAQELLKCQRYFISFGDSSAAEALGFGQGTLTDNAVIYVPIPVKMRANPSIATLTGTIYLRNESTPYVITNAHVEVGGVACVAIGASATGAIPGKPYEAFLEIGAKLELSADL